METKVPNELRWSRGRLCALAHGSGIHALAFFLFMGLILAGSNATAISFQADFNQTTYQVVAGNTFDDLILAHETGTFVSSNILTTTAGISASVYAGNVNRDYSLLITTDFMVASGYGGLYEFQIGTDWGRGGGGKVINSDNGQVLYEYVTTEDIWWDNDWNNADVLSTGQIMLNAGTSYSLAWVGFEGCCAGSATIRFSSDGGSTFQTLDSFSIDPYVVPIPEPGSALLLGLGLSFLAWNSRKIA